MNDETTSPADGTAEDAWSTDARTGVADADDDGCALLVDVDGYEGPLDLLLALARTQKVDLARISIVALVDQYLAFIAEARHLRLEVAADYLVMAAWLAFLKSRLLLPREEAEGDQMSASEAAQRLAFRLMRLEAMRKAAAELMARNRLGRDVFARGWREPVESVRDTRYSADIVDLLKAYADQRKRTIKVSHVVKARKVWSIKDARVRLERMIGENIGRWTQLDLFLEQFLAGEYVKKTVLASSFGATLEMAREGLVELRQDVPFGPIYMRRREQGAPWQRVGE